MKSVKFNSTSLRDASYDEAKQELIVHFHSGHVYRYPNVTPAQFSALLNADSPGKHFYNNLRDGKFKRLK